MAAAAAKGKRCEMLAACDVLGGENSDEIVAMA